jgi:hypothetical protein
MGGPCDTMRMITNRMQILVETLKVRNFFTTQALMGGLY